MTFPPFIFINIVGARYFLLVSYHAVATLSRAFFKFFDFFWGDHILMGAMEAMETLCQPE